MRTRRAKGRTTSRYSYVLEQLEARYLLTDLVGDTPATATDLGTLTTAQPLEIFGAIDAAFDLDVFRFQAGAQETATIELSADFSSLDTYVRLLDSSGNAVAFDDDSGPGTNSLLRFTVVGGETYFVEAGDFFDGTGDFFLTISLDVGDTISTATDLGLLTEVSPVSFFGTIEQPADRDVFQFETFLAGSATIQLTGDFNSLDTIVTLFDSLGNQLATNDDFGASTNSQLTFELDAGETYFVEANGFSTATGDYFLAVYLEIGDTLSNATDLGLLTNAEPISVASIIEQAFDRDVFQFQAAATGMTVVELNRGFGFLDAFVTVLDSSGNVIAFDDDSGPGVDSRLMFAAEAGATYFVEARGFGSSVGEYFLSITRDDGFPVASATDLGNLTGILQASGTLEASELNDLFLFTATTNGLVEVRETASANDFFLLDSVLRAFEGNNNVPIATDFGTFDTTVPRVVSFPVVAGQSYFAEVSGYFGSVGQYDITITLFGEVGDTIGDAEDLGHLTGNAPLNFESQIDTSFDRDVFMFQADTSGATVVELDASFSPLNLDADFSLLNTVVTVFDSHGIAIASSDDIDANTFESNSLLVFTAVADQTYFVEARGAGSSTGEYSLRILPPVVPTNVGALTTAATATRPLTRSGTLEPTEFNDLFIFTAVATGNVQVTETADPVDAESIPFDGILFAFDTLTGARVAVDFGSSDTTVPRVATFSVIAGQTYLAEITGFARSSGDYQLSFNYVTDDVPPAGVAFEFPSRSGSIEVSGDIDTYRLTADADQMLQISLDAASESFLAPVLNVRVFVSNDLTTPLNTYSNDDFGFGFNSFLSVPVLTGQVIEVDAQGFGSSRGRYNLTIIDAVVTDLVADIPAIGSIETAFSTDVFRFLAESSGVATIDVSSFDSPALPLDAIGDPIVTIRETLTGDFVAFDDDSGPGLNSFATFAVTPGTQYDVVVGGFGSRTGNYRVTLSTNAGDAGDDGDTFDQATALSFVNNSQSISRDGIISPPSTNRPNDVDVFSFTASSNGTLLIRATPTSPSLQAGLSVFQASPTGNTADVELLAVAVPPDGVDTGVRQLFVPVSEGRTYFFRVSGLNGTDGNYFLFVEDQNDQVPGEAPGTVLDLDDITGLGTPANLSDQTINFQSDRDWYRVIAPAIGEFTINLDRASGSALDPLLTIYNVQGLAIVRNDDSSESSVNSRLTLQASRANEVFYVETAGINETTGDYRLTVQFAAQPADDFAADDFGSDVGHSSVIPEGSPGRFEQQGLLEATGDRDFFAFTAVVGGSFNLQLVTQNGEALPAGVEVQVFEVEASSLSFVSLDNLTRVASMTSEGGELALNLPGDDSSISIQRSPDDLQRTERSFLVAVSNVGATANIGYNLSINVAPGVASQNLQLQNAALFALLSLADGAAAMGDQNPEAINAAIQAAINELGKSGNFLVVLLDPVNDPVLTDSAGRQTGFVSNTGTLNGVPGGYASVGSFGQVLIVPINILQPGSISLQFAGVGSLDQAQSSFSAFVVGPSGSSAVSQMSPSTNNEGGKGNFVVQLGFGDSVISTPSTASGAQSPSFFMMTNNDRPPPSGATMQSVINDSAIVQLDDVRPEKEPKSQPDPFDLVLWRDVLDGVLQELQIEGLSRPNLNRVLLRLQENDSKLTGELMTNFPVVRSAKAMYEVLKQSAGWLRNAKPATPPAPKQRTTIPKVTQQETSPSKNAPQARLGSKKVTHLGG